MQSSRREASARAASRERLKLCQDRGIVVVVVTRADINAVVDGYNFITRLRVVSRLMWKSMTQPPVASFNDVIRPQTAATANRSAWRL
jgi:hypothetical protein